MKQRHLLALMLLALTASPVLAQNNQLEKAILAVQAVGLNGKGNAAAAEAMKVLNAAGPEQVVPILRGIPDDNPIAANWLRAAAQRATARAKGNLPTDELAAFFADKANGGKARLLAFQILCNTDAKFFASNVSALADDPAMLLREIGIQQLIDQANAVDDDDSKKRPLLRQAFESARDVEQVTAIGKSLSAMGESIDLTGHLGMLTTWELLSGFDNKDMGGFDVVYGPEKSPLEIAESYDGAIDGTARWVKGGAAKDSMGKVDLNKVVGKKKGIIGYASRTFNSPIEGPAEIRIGTQNAHKIWLNGEEVMSNEIYHNSNSIDKFTAPITLNKGENKILIKLCQNEQTQPWAQEWAFQVRICDATGKAIQEAK